MNLTWSADNESLQHNKLNYLQKIKTPHYFKTVLLLNMNGMAIGNMHP